MTRLWRLSDVCRLSVAYIGPKSRTERSRETKIGTEVGWYSPRHTWLGYHFQGQKVKGQLVADVLNSQHGGTGVTWRMNTKILSTCRPGRWHIVPASRTACYITAPGCGEASNCRYWFYSQAENQHFHHARATRCTDSCEIGYGPAASGSAWPCEFSP